MLPELILSEKYDLSEEFVIARINEYDFRGKAIYQDKGFEVCRIGGYRYRKNAEGTKEVIAWQCNLADIQNYDIRLPTVIHICINKENAIKSINLNKCFKGSQGIPCSHKYLNRRLQRFLDLQFNSNEDLIKDPLSTACRHTYELIFGASTFVEWCEENDIDDAVLSEATSAYENENGIIAIDRIVVNGKESISKIQISDFKEEIHYNLNGAIDKCSDMKIQGWKVKDNQEGQIGEIKVLEAKSANDFKIKMMKILSKYWLQSGKHININKKFYFSQLWPTTLFGILSQMFAIAVFSNNYSYFQHCIQGLQKDDDNCACIGVCTNIDECKRYFDDFSEDDLF